MKILASYFEDFEIWGCLLKIDAQLCCTLGNIHGSSIKVFSLFKYQSV